MKVPKLRFSHMGFSAHDLTRMEQFYTTMLGFFVTDRGSLPGPDGIPVPLVFLSRDPDEHHQIVLAGNRPAQLHHNTINQISLRTDNLTTLLEIFRNFRDAGVDDMHPITHGNAISLYCRDPEGNRLEIYIDTDFYVDQPMRVALDFEQPEAAILADVEKHARTLPGFRPRAQWRAEMVRLMGA